MTRFVLSETQRTFFSHHSLLELENIVSDSDCDRLLQLPQGTRNLWKESLPFQKILFKLSIGHMAKELFRKHPIRLGFTQGLCTSKPFLSKTTSLEEIASLTPIAGGALLCLSASPKELSPMPDLQYPQAKSITFFSSTTPIPFPSLWTDESLVAILFCFTPQHIRYKMQPADPYTHIYKKSGIVFGDLLPENECPYLTR